MHKLQDRRYRCFLTVVVEHKQLEVVVVPDIVADIVAEDIVADNFAVDNFAAERIEVAFWFSGGDLFVFKV